MNGYTLYIIDTETTGLDCSIHEVVELAMARVTFDENNKIQQESKSWLIRATNAVSLSEEALAVSGHLREEVLGLTAPGVTKYRPASQVVPEIELWMMEDNVSGLDRLFIGQNPSFDLGFLQVLWKKVGSPETFPFEIGNNNRMLDTKQLVILVDLATGNRRLKYNLGSLVKAFGVKKRKAHRAEEDVLMTTELLLTILEPLRPILASKFKNSYLSEDLV